MVVGVNAGVWLWACGCVVVGVGVVCGRQDVGVAFFGGNFDFCFF